MQSKLQPVIDILKTVCIVFEINFVHINSHISQRLFSDSTARELPRSELVKIYILKFTPKPSDMGRKILKRILTAEALIAKRHIFAALLVY